MINEFGYKLVSKCSTKSVLWSPTVVGVKSMVICILSFTASVPFSGLTEKGLKIKI